MECLPALGARNFDSFVQKWPCNNNGYGYWPPVQREFPFALDRRDDQLLFLWVSKAKCLLTPLFPLVYTQNWRYDLDQGRNLTLIKTGPEVKTSQI